MYNVTVGYAGGRKLWPTYKNIQDHTEAVRVVYDPNILSFDDILDAYFDELGGPPISPSYNRQYAALILVHSNTQRIIAEQKVQNWSQIYGGRKLYIEVLDGTEFYQAEEYHQKYLQKQQKRRNGDT